MDLKKYRLKHKDYIDLCVFRGEGDIVTIRRQNNPRNPKKFINSYHWWLQYGPKEKKS